MTEAIEVHIELEGRTRLVGLCRYIAKPTGTASVFEYDAGWLEDPTAFAIDPEQLPLQPGPIARRGRNSALPGAIRDTAPDRWGQQLIRRAYQKAGMVRALSEIDHLLGLNDATRIGALRYRRSGARGFDHQLGAYRVPPLIRLPALLQAADAIHRRSESADELRLLLNEGSPLGGARPKSAIEDKDGSLAIAKFPKPDDDRSIPHGEVLAMTLARAAGLEVATARLVDVAGRPVSVVSRFDREGAARIPFVSAMTMLGLDDGEVATYTDIAEVIRKHAADPLRDLRELFSRMVFNVLISNLDDHLRNHAFLHAGQGRWRLAPAYDLNPVPAFEKARELTTWISEAAPEASLDHAQSAARFFGLKPEEAASIIEHQRAAVSQWRTVAKGLGMAASDVELYATAFENAGG
jgi:serine/threonine-protein kinase HipA